MSNFQRVIPTFPVSHHHTVKVSATKSYRMQGTWIDTDNECWAEPNASVPYDEFLNRHSKNCIRTNGQGPLFNYFS